MELLVLREDVQTCVRACVCPRTADRAGLLAWRLGAWTKANPPWGQGCHSGPHSPGSPAVGRGSDDLPGSLRDALGQEDEQMWALLRLWSRVTV